MRERRPRVTREAVALIGAAALHALGWWALREQPSPQPVQLSVRAHEPIEIGVETAALDDAVTPQTAPAQGDASRPIARTPDSAIGAVGGVGAAQPPVAELADGRAALEERSESALGIDPQANASSDSESSAPVAPESSAPIDLGIGENGWQRWATVPMVAAEGAAVAAAPSTGAARRPFVRAPVASKSGGLQEGLEERSRALGLGPSGRVVSALRGAAHHRDAPELGKARFQITVTRDGTVEVAVAAATEPRDAWESVARRAAADLRRKPPRIPAGRAGARLVVELIADERFPSGVASKSLKKPRLEAVAPRLRSVEEGKKEIEELNPTAASDSVPLQEQIANTEVPGVFVAGKNKVCDYRAGVTPLGTLQAPSGNRDRNAGTEFRIQGACDPSNLEAKAGRVVRLAVVDEQLF